MTSVVIKIPYYVPLYLDWRATDWSGASRTVWPDLAIFHHFGNFYAFGHIFIVVNGLKVKNNIGKFQRGGGAGGRKGRLQLLLNTSREAWLSSRTSPAASSTTWLWPRRTRASSMSSPTPDVDKKTFRTWSRRSTSSKGTKTIMMMMMGIPWVFPQSIRSFFSSKVWQHWSSSHERNIERII